MATTRAIKAGPRRSVFSKFEISPNLDAIARVGRPGRPARPRQQHQRVPRHRPHPGHPRTTGDYARLLDITKWEGAQGFRSYAETESLTRSQGQANSRLVCERTELKAPAVSIYFTAFTVHAHVHLAATSRYLQGSSSPFSLPQSPPTALLWQVPRSNRVVAHVFRQLLAPCRPPRARRTTAVARGTPAETWFVRVRGRDRDRIRDRFRW